MERSTSVPTGMGEQSLTPGEQRILALMEQGQQRLEQRLQSLEEGQQRTDQRLDRMDQRLDRMDQRLDRMDQRLDHMDQRLQSLEEGQQRTNQQLQDLMLKVDMEAAASKTRDRQLAAEMERTRQVEQERALSTQRSTLASIYLELNALRAGLSERLDQHNTRLEMLERTIELNCEHLRENSRAIQALQQDMRKLTAVVEGLVQLQAPRVASMP